MELKRTRYFLAAARCLSINKAAEELFISPQALHRNLGEFEEEMGAKLFDRSPKGLELTGPGKLCAELMEAVVSMYENAAGQVRQAAVAGRHLRACFFSALSSSETVAPWLEKLSLFVPGEDINLISGDMHSVERWLDIGEADIALTNCDETMIPQHWHWSTLEAQQVMIAVPSNHPWYGRGQVEPEEMEQACMVQLRDPEGAWVDDFYHRVKCREIRVVHQFTSLLALLESGRYFAAFPRSEEAGGQLWYIPLPEQYKFNVRTICACLDSAPAFLRQIVDQWG